MVEQRRALMEGSIDGGEEGGADRRGEEGGDLRQAEPCTNSCVDTYSNILRSSSDLFCH
jgi:hypothetical protein